MKNFIYNIGYFMKEVIKLIRMNFLSNIVSLISTGLILFLLGLVLAGYGISNQMVSMLQEEAEISTYFNEKITDENTELVLSKVKAIPGVKAAYLVDEDMAYARMDEVLGEEAKILELFEENPFESYIEINIQLENMEQILYEVENLEGVQYVRDNRDVLKRIESITEGIKLIGIFVLIAVSVTTLVIISHMIRQGIYNNKDQIRTLRLLGAPNSFIGFPFVLVGVILTLGGGLLASTIIIVMLNQGYEELSRTISFIPLPKKELVISDMIHIIIGVSSVLGLLGSFLGLFSIKNNDKS
jgi:cell division transport system permease protein